MTGDLIIANWHDTDNSAASEVRGESFKSKEVGIKKKQETFVIPCAHGSLRQEVHAQRQNLRHQRVERFDAQGVHITFGQPRISHVGRKRITLCSMQIF